MRPFKFFFAASVVAILAIFMLRVLFAAFILAIIFSTGYFIIRSLSNFFRGMTWEGRIESEFDHFKAHHRSQEKYSEPLFETANYGRRPVHFERIIRIN